MDERELDAELLRTYLAEMIGGIQQTLSSDAALETAARKAGKTARGLTREERAYLDTVRLRLQGRETKIAAAMRAVSISEVET